jgi:hypothetical protein
MSALRELVGDAATTLLCAPSMSSTDGCRELLSAAGAGTTVLWVSYTRSPEACVERYREAVDAGGNGDGPSLSVITVGDTATETDSTAPSDVTVQTVSTAKDLTALGVMLSQTISDHEHVVLCFDSLTVLLQYVDRETAYEFLNAVTGHLYAADASAHFHLDPTAHDRRTVDALASLFDAIAEREDGEWSVRTRR